MRFDKLTTKFQQAFSDAQSLALGNDNGFIEPQHLLAALLAQEDGGTTSLLARAGQVLTLALGVARLRACSLAQQRRLVSLLAESGVDAIGGDDNHGAFVTIADARAEAWSDALRGRAIITDARGRYLRLCPDVLTTDAELVLAAKELAAARPSGSG